MALGKFGFRFGGNSQVLPAALAKRAGVSMLGDVEVEHSADDPNGDGQDQDTRLIEFCQVLDNLYAFKTIGELTPRVAALRKEFDAIHQLGDYVGSDALRKQLNVHAERIHKLESEAEQIETVIGYRSPPNGKLYVDKFTAFNNDRNIASAMLGSPSEEERRRGKVRLEGIDKAEREWFDETERLNKRLKALRG